MNLTKEQQVEIIKKTLKLDECNCCDFKAVFMYTFKNSPLCPHCDGDLIDELKNNGANDE